jgi:uncharacterized protein YciI
MPLFAIHALDKPQCLSLRLDHYAAHRAYVERETSHAVTVVLSGPLQSDDGDMMIGSLLIVDEPDRETVQRFVDNDPFCREGVWASVQINRFHRRKG